MDLTRSQILLYALAKELGGIDDKVKLAKLQYFADFIHYAFHNTPISESTTPYEKRKFGPLSATFNSDLRALCDAGLLKQTSDYKYEIAKDITPALEDVQFETLKYVVDKYAGHSYDQLADITHKQIPYMTAVDGGIIDFNTAYNLVEEYTDYEAAR